MPRRKDRIIIDTNLWISFLINKNYSRLDSIIADERIVLLYSPELIDEFIEVTRRPKLKRYFDAKILQELLSTISSVAEFIEVESFVDACRDPKDNFLLSLAKDGKATHIVTGDFDLLSMKSFLKTKILPMSEYLESL